MLSPPAFLELLDGEHRVALDRIAAKTSTPTDDDGAIQVTQLLVFALKNELEATECAAAWIASTPEINVKLALARQAGDEAKHYRMILNRLTELGFDSHGHDPFAKGKSPLFAYLLGLHSTVERVAAGQFTREALALVRNTEFIRFCRARGDEKTAALYADVIQPDEQHHHELGRSLLAKLVTTDEAQRLARAASAQTLSMAEELQEIARLKMGVAHAPGC